MPFTLNEEAKKYNNIRKIEYSTTEKIYRGLHYDDKLHFDDRATLQFLDNKLAISQNNPMCNAEEQQPKLRKQHRLSLE